MISWVVWLSNLSFGLGLLVMVGLPVAIVMGLAAFIRHRVGFDSLDANNEVAGFKYAVLGVVYAVLLGFAVSVVWEKFRDGGAAVMHEAAEISTIYRLADGLGPVAADSIHRADDTYGNLVLTQEGSSRIAQDWPSAAVTDALSHLFTAVLAAKPQTAAEAAVFQTLLSSLDALSQARRDRLELGFGTVPDVIWLVLFAGGFLVVAFMLFFGTRHIWVQVLMTGMVAAVVFIGLFAIVMINYPFSGSVRVSMEPISYALEHAGPQP